MVPVARSLLALYGVAAEDIEALAQIARDARKRGWWHAYDQVLPEWFSTYVGLEAEADEIKTLETQLVPGLLQTPDYARAVIAAEHPDSPAAEIDRRIELRMRRQELDSPPRLWAITGRECAAPTRRRGGGHDPPDRATPGGRGPPAGEHPGNSARGR